MAIETDTGFFFVRPPDVAQGRVVITPDGPQPYKVVFRLGDSILSEHPVATVREGEALIRRELANVQFTTRTQRPDPEAPSRNR